MIGKEGKTQYSLKKKHFNKMDTELVIDFELNYHVGFINANVRRSTEYGCNS